MQDNWLHHGQTITELEFRNQHCMHTKMNNVLIALTKMLKRYKAIDIFSTLLSFEGKRYACEWHATFQNWNPFKKAVYAC